MHALPEDIARYRGRYSKGWDVLRQERHEKQLAMKLFGRCCPLSPRDPQVPSWQEATDKHDWDLRMAPYAAMVDRMDQGIGRILSHIKQSGEENNTLVVFSSDNGGCSLLPLLSHRNNLPAGPAESNTGYDRPWANASNTPFRGFKSDLYKAGSRRPWWSDGRLQSSRAASRIRPVI